MRKPPIAISLAILLTIVAAYLGFADQLPPRTPLKVARVISELPVPGDAQILSYTDMWPGPNGDGLSEVRLQLTDQEFATLESLAREQRYEPTTPAELQRNQVTQLDPDARGLLRIRHNERKDASYDLALLDERTKQLFVRNVVK